MLEHAWNETGPRFKAWLAALLLLIGIGGFCYSIQLGTGLGVTGMSRDVSWGLYIGQFTFFVGVAASAVMVVLPYYLHDVKVFGRITIVGEFLAVTAVIMCILFILVDLGMPSRLLNIMLYPSPGSVLFWDMVVLNGYFFLNLFYIYVKILIWFNKYRLSSIYCNSHNTCYICVALNYNFITNAYP